MGLRVNTNIASMTAQRHKNVVTRRLGENYARLASGLRIATAADDAAGLAISERMRSQIRSYSVAARNAQDGVSLAQTAEGALSEVSNIISRMRELAMQSANGTLNDLNDRPVLDAEFQEARSRPGQLQARGLELGGLAPASDSDPDCARQLRGELVEGQRGDQVDHRTGHTRGHFDQRVVLSDVGLGMHVEAPADAEELALVHQTTQDDARDAQRLEVAGADHASLSGEVEDLVGLGGGHCS